MEFIDLIKNSKITSIKRTLDLIMIAFESNGKKIYLHIQCFVRIFDVDGTLIICSDNMYCKSPTHKKKKFDWTEVGTTLFDDSLNDYKDKILSTHVVSASFDNHDIKLVFENGMSMDVLRKTTKYEDMDYSEDYRFFDDDENIKPYCIPPIE